MKTVLTCTLFFMAGMAFGQSDFPDFLAGTWKMQDKDIHEHWDRLDSRTLKGFSYTYRDGRMQVSEYLEIVQKGDDVVYIAAVINQNKGKGIEFRLTRTDSVFHFGNPEHDFPKSIVYRKLSENEIFVNVSDGKEKGFTYRMKRLPPVGSGKGAGGSNPEYDEATARRLAADDYGMKNYIFVILKTGPVTGADKELVSESFRGHLDNIRALVGEGKLIVAGPLGKNDRQYRGIFILDKVHSMEEAAELLRSDPAIRNGLLDYELFTWYGSAALPEYLPVADRIWKLKP
jgi:uncharacterized protein YciI